MAGDREKPAEKSNAGASPGQRLRAAREKKKLKVRDLAKELHLDRWMLDALERDDYDALGAPVFAKGHLRKYARTLGLDPDEMMISYYQTDGSRDVPPLLSESALRLEAEQRRRDYNWWLPVALGLGTAVLVGLAIWWFLQPPETPASVDGVDLPVEPELDTALTIVPQLPAERGREPAAEPQPADDPPLTVDPALEEPLTAPPEPPAATITLTLRFNDESWVEVYDNRRTKLLYGLGEANSVKYLSGEPPIQVFLGRQSGVTVEVNGEPFEIPSNARRGNTARFRVEGS